MALALRAITFSHLDSDFDLYQLGLRFWSGDLLSLA